MEYMRPLVLMLLILASHFETALGADTLSLADYLIRAQSQSFDIAIEKSVNNEITSRSQGLRISPPMLGFMKMNEAGNFNNGIEISQELAFPSKISKEKEVREYETKSQDSLFYYRKNAILIDARNAYFEFWQAYEKNKILLKKQDWLKGHVKISRTRVRGDSAAQVHLLGLESEADLIENEVLASQSELIEKANALKNFVPDINVEKIRPQEPLLENIEVTIDSKSSFIIWKEHELTAAESTRDLKKQSYLPDLILRYRSFNGNEMTPRSEELMIGITLPFLFYGQPRSEISEASARTQRARTELQKARVDLEISARTLLQKSESLKKQLLMLKDKLIPRAHRRIKLVENLSVRTQEGLDDHRMVMLDFFELKMKELDTRIEYEKVVSDLFKIVGKEKQL